MKKPSKKKLQEMLDRYVKLNHEKKQAEEELKKLKNDLIELNPELVGYEIKISDRQRENFSLKEVREYLTEKQFEKYVEPYIKVTEFKMLTIKKVG